MKVALVVDAVNVFIKFCCNSLSTFGKASCLLHLFVCCTLERYIG